MNIKVAVKVYSNQSNKNLYIYKNLLAGQNELEWSVIFLPIGIKFIKFRPLDDLECMTKMTRMIFCHFPNQAKPFVTISIWN